jgi:hypothetical protein
VVAESKASENCIRERNRRKLLASTHLFVGNELHQVVQLLDSSRRHWLDVLLSLLGLARELWQELLGDFIADQDDAAFAQALQRSVQAARGRAKVNDDIDESLAGVVCSLN